MEAIVRKVRDIGERERHVLERVLGQKLRENEQVIIQVVTLGSDATQSPEKGEAPAEEELPEWCNVYEGLTDDEIADLESVILERANLTRPS
jgi:hypothetical protein